jgi:hypothetical protein
MPSRAASDLWEAAEEPWRVALRDSPGSKAGRRGHSHSYVEEPQGYPPEGWVGRRGCPAVTVLLV